MSPSLFNLEGAAQVHFEVQQNPKSNKCPIITKINQMVYNSDMPDIKYGLFYEGPKIIHELFWLGDYEGQFANPRFFYEG